MAARRGRARSDLGSELFPGFSEVVEIGVGSLATIYRAREAGTKRLVALKLLNVRDASPRALESFERESMALGALSSHPNIVTLYRSFPAADGRPVLVLELCRGAVCDRLRAGGGLPVRDAVSIAIKVGGALETAHRVEILHRDVKPQNILITEFGEPALADFGVAMLQASTQTTAGLFDFTTLHAAPELLDGGATSPATDVYELASTLYELITGQSAFRAYDGESPASVILRILRDPVRPVVAPDVPVGLSDLLIRAMSKDKDNRPPTAAEFAAELSQIEVARGWPRTQFLIRDSSALGGVRIAPAITRLPASPSREVAQVAYPAPARALPPELDLPELDLAELDLEPSPPGFSRPEPAAPAPAPSASPFQRPAFEPVPLAPRTIIEPQLAPAPAEPVTPTTPTTPTPMSGEEQPPPAAWTVDAAPSAPAKPRYPIPPAGLDAYREKARLSVELP